MAGYAEPERAERQRLADVADVGAQRLLFLWNLLGNLTARPQFPFSTGKEGNILSVLLRWVRYLKRNINCGTNYQVTVNPSIGTMQPPVS